MKARWIIFGLAASTACQAPDAHRSDPPGLALEEISRLGTMDGAGSALTSVSGVALTDSTVLVLEASPARVAVFSRDGAWLRDFGRQGEGPGEFRRPTRLGIVGGEVWVGDPAGRRLELFLADGSPLRSFRWQVAPDSMGVQAFPSAPLADGSILAGPGNLELGSASRGWVKHRAYFRATAEGENLGEVYREELVSSDFVAGEFPDGGVFVGMHPIPEFPLVALYPDGSGFVAVERLAARGPGEAFFRVRVFSVGGDVETDISVPYGPVPADGWLDRYLREIEDDMMERSGAVDPQTVDAFRDALTDRAYYPPVTRVVAGADGSIWIRREESAADSVRWDVLARNGEPLGRLSTPTELRLHLASLEEVWAVELNDLDVPFVVQMRVLR
ncbi:MAG: 6-bladed beta-propeller [Longimicrobiales bacterium]